MRRLTLFPVLLALALCATATTLQELSLDEMIQKSTAIVRAQVIGRSTLTQDTMIYTQFHLNVEEQWKGTPARRIDVVLPGGTTATLRQTFSGVPSLELNKEYIFFLWTGSNGVTQIIGLSQGLFELNTGADGVQYVDRPEIKAAIVNQNGAPASGVALRLRLDQLAGRIKTVLAAAAR